MRYLPKAKIDEIFEKGVATIAWGEVRCRSMISEFLRLTNGQFYLLNG